MPRTNPAHIHKTMPDTIAMFKSLQPLLDEHVNNIHALEIPLYSHHLKVAGRVDCIAEYDGKLSIIDFNRMMYFDFVRLPKFTFKLMQEFFNVCVISPNRV